MFERWVPRSRAGSCARRGTFSLVCFRAARAPTSETGALLERVNASGEIFISHAVLDGRYVLRLAIGQMRHEREGRADRMGCA